MYYLAINRLKPGVVPETFRAFIPDHIDWVKEQITAGTVVQAGRWGRDGGVWIIRAGSEAEARELLGDDPLVRSGHFAFELDQFHPDVAQVRYELPKRAVP